MSNFSYCLQVFPFLNNFFSSESDFSVNFRFRLDHGWRRLDFSSVSRMDRHIEMMMAIEKALIQTKCLVQPSIYIMPEVEKGICGTTINSHTLYLFIASIYNMNLKK